MKIFCLFAILQSMLWTSSLPAQPSIPKENIPKAISYELQGQIERLYSSEAVERAYALIEIGDMGASAWPAIPFLISLLGEGYRLEAINFGEKAGGGITNVGKIAAISLGRIGKVSLDPLISHYHTNENKPHIKMDIAIALGKIGGDSAISVLTLALKDNNVYVRTEAASALGETHSRKAVLPLINALNDEGGTVAEMAAEALGKIKDRRAVRPLIQLLDHRYLSDDAIAALGEIGDTTAVSYLLRYSGKADDPDRELAIVALGSIKDRRAVDRLIALLTDQKESWSIRKAAARALGSFKQKKVVNALIASLNDSNMFVIENAARSLGAIGDTLAIAALRRRLINEDDSNVRKSINWALRELEKKID